MRSNNLEHDRTPVGRRSAPVFPAGWRAVREAGAESYEYRHPAAQGAPRSGRLPRAAPCVCWGLCGEPGRSIRTPAAQVCNHPELFERRQARAPFHCGHGGAGSALAEVSAAVHGRAKVRADTDAPFAQRSTAVGLRPPQPCPPALAPRFTRATVPTAVTGLWRDGASLILLPPAGPSGGVCHGTPLPAALHPAEAALEGRPRMPPDKRLRVSLSRPGVSRALGHRRRTPQPLCRGPHPRLLHGPGGNRNRNRNLGRKAGRFRPRPERRVRVSPTRWAGRSGGVAAAAAQRRLAQPVRAPPAAPLSCTKCQPCRCRLPPSAVDRRSSQPAESLVFFVLENCGISSGGRFRGCGSSPRTPSRTSGHPERIRKQHKTPRQWMCRLPPRSLLPPPLRSEVGAERAL